MTVKDQPAMPKDHRHLSLHNNRLAFDHPEAVAWGPDGKAYAGGEQGQLYRFSLNGKSLEEKTRLAGGFLLGLAHDAAGNTYACIDRSAHVHRITPDGKTAAFGEPNTKSLVIAGLCGWWVHAGPMTMPGLRMRPTSLL
jgi:sugar lactone lactonase YvrE